MPEIRGITVAVGDHYARTLSVALWQNMRHFTECLVVTTPDDEEVKAVVAGVPGARTYETNDFYSYGAKFNKGLCMERGFDVLGRHGYICIFDADIVFPPSMPWGKLRPDALHGARRRILADPDAYRPDLDWGSCPPHQDGGPIGFAQIFMAETIRDKRPWYDVSFAHGGGGDAYFMCHWPREKLEVLDVDVLHLGVPDQHWFGTDREGKDMMAAFVHRNGWGRAMRKSDPTAVHRVGPIVERVQVPGYAPSNYELPFVRRAQEQRGRRP